MKLNLVTSNYSFTYCFCFMKFDKNICMKNGELNKQIFVKFKTLIIFQA